MQKENFFSVDDKTLHLLIKLKTYVYMKKKFPIIAFLLNFLKLFDCFKKGIRKKKHELLMIHNSQFISILHKNNFINHTIKNIF